MGLFPLVALLIFTANVIECMQNAEDFEKTLKMLTDRVYVFGPNLEQCKEYQTVHSPSYQSTVKAYDELLSSYNATNMRQLEIELQDLYLRASKGCSKCIKACSNAISDACHGRDCSSGLKKKVKSGCKAACKSQFD